MKHIRTPLATAVAVGLLAATAVAVAAQDGPVEFSAEWRFGPLIEAGESFAEDDRVVSRGDVWQPGTVTEATDSRFRGDITNSWNHDDYPDGPEIGMVTFTVRNSEGAWIMRPALTVGFPGDQWWPLLGAIFDGEGAYEGLLALANIETADSRFHLRGYIVDEDSLPDVEAYRPGSRP